ncbi:HlyD family type I secretion periplasmic adaptor subunit [Aliagarivorans marinus]|uniref:HlyD family type I secretion periplasmic adaptor subunit n=1 Tax=Aliagarivorans marinus TaxID=561965 RepID=UPI000418C35A|nr:HlyD family type I secretion periplasmic adaptor subunit [Aliagarivorans marinus]
MSRSKPNAKDLDYIDDIHAAILLKTPWRSRAVLWMIFLFVGCALYWAHLAEVDEVTVGSGKVIPSQQIQVVQSLEGGILKQLLVSEGEQVEKGQPLVRIDDTRFRSDFLERGQRIVDLQGDVGRFNHELSAVQVVPDLPLSDWQKQVLVVPGTLSFDEAFESEHPIEAQRQRLQMEARLRTLSNQLNIGSGQIEQRQQELVELASKVDHLRQSYALVQEELRITRPLADEGIVSQVDVLKLERQANELRGEIASSTLLKPKIESAIAETIYKRRDQALAFLSETRQQLNEAQAELSALSEGQVGLRDRVERTLLMSPVKGTVKKIYLNTVGGVVQPGLSVMEIVPIEDKLLVEAKIQPKDIAFLRPGLKTVVKFSAYDFSIYGGLDGQLEQISADTIVDEEGNSFYLVKVRTEQSALGDNQDLAIIPGMLANVDIITGKKSILDYLLKPITKAQQTALRER